MNPDQVMDRATEPPATDAQTAIAFGRSAGGKTVARSESVPGMTRAAPTPIAARAAISSPTPVQKAPHTAATV